MSLRLGHRAEVIVRSEIRNMSVECERVGGINLSQGVCDTEIPLPVRRGAQLAIDVGPNTYTRHDGIAELRNVLARKLARENSIEVDPETEIVVTAGSTGAFYCACMALLDPGDEVVLFEPYYGYHLNTLLAVDAKATFVPLRAPDWSFSPEALENAITPRTRGIMICTPSNPCGKVWTREELELVGKIAQRHDLFIFTDEVYEYFVFGDKPHISPGSIPSLRDRTISMYSLSKTFSITGWRLGYAACDQRWAKMIGYMNDLVYVCAPAPLQKGVAEGISTLGSDYYAALRETYRAKRDLLCNALTDVGLTPVVPDGAYYVLADLSRLPGGTSKERAMHLLQSTGVASVPGEAFFHDEVADRFVRFCFAKPDDALEEACRRLRKLR